MKAVLLDAAPASDSFTLAAADGLAHALAARGYEVERYVIRDLDVRACTGCFGCWTKRPGECVIDDDARRIAASVAAGDLCAIVAPARFGTFGSLAKAVQDRMVGLLLPFFMKIDGEIHHKPRYPRYPSFLGFGTLPRHDDDVEATFSRLVARQALNMHSPTHAANVVAPGDEIGECAARALDSLRPKAKVAR